MVMPSDLTSEVRRRLEEITGPGSVIGDRETMEPYGRDMTPGKFSPPEIVVRPADAVQVAGILKLARELGFPVIPRGAGTGVVGGAIPFEGGVVLSLEKMNRILEIDRDNMMAVVEPAVVTGDLQREAEARGLFYPPDPASLSSCSLGGNVATGAGGPRAVKYGVTRDYVCGLEVVLPTGEILELGGKIVKYASGYHLLDLFVGSEGTLGVVTRITLRLLSLPPHRVDLLVPFAGLDDAARAVTEIIRQRILPSTLEFMDRGAIEASRRFLGRKIPFEGAGAHLLVEVDGHHREQVLADCEEVGSICRKCGAEDVLVADSLPVREKLWETRRSVGEALKAQHRDVGKQDVVVPRMSIPELIRRVGPLGVKHGVQTVCFGHAGDGNVHINILPGPLDEAAWQQRLEAVLSEIVREVCDLGGMLSGEHGIGWMKKRHLARILPPRHLELMRGIKEVFDPAGVLNPGKVIDIRQD